MSTWFQLHLSVAVLRFIHVKAIVFQPLHLDLCFHIILCFQDEISEPQALVLLSLGKRFHPSLFLGKSRERRLIIQQFVYVESFCLHVDGIYTIGAFHLQGRSHSESVHLDCICISCECGSHSHCQCPYPFHLDRFSFLQKYIFFAKQPLVLPLFIRIDIKKVCHG